MRYLFLRSNSGPAPRVLHVGWAVKQEKLMSRKVMLLDVARSKK